MRLVRLLVLTLAACSTQRVGHCLTCESPNAWKSDQASFPCVQCGVQLLRVDCPSCTEEFLVLPGSDEPAACPMCGWRMESAALKR